MKFVGFFIVCLAVACFAAEKPWQFSEFFQGEWQVDKISYEKFGALGSTLEGYMNMTTSTLPGVLLGAYKATETVDGFTVRVEPDTDAHGSLKFYIPSEIEDLEEIVLLDVNYNFVKTSHMSYYISDGVFKSSTGTGNVEFIITSPNTWILTLRYTQGSHEIIRWIGKKEAPVAPISFLGRWGFSIILAGFFMATRLFFGQKK